MKLTVRELVTFAMLGSLMWVSKLVMEWLPNMHLLAVITVAVTVCYRQKALYILATYILLLGAVNGFPPWWVIHTYVWTILWGATMLLPRRMKPAVAAVVYAVLGGAHGFLYGTMCAPVQVLLFGTSVAQIPAWIVAGLPFDITHGVSNVIASVLTLPLIALIRRCERVGRN